MAAVLLALGSSLAFGVGDFLGGVAARRLTVLTVLVLSQLVGLAGIVVVVAVRGAGPPGADSLALGLGAALFGAAGITLLYRGLAVGLMSVVAPIAATAAVIPVVTGALTGEGTSWAQNAGIALALGGVVLVSREEAGAVARGRLAAGAGLGLAAALAIGLFLVVFDRAAEDDPYWASLAVRLGSVAIFVAAALVRRPPLRVGAPTLAVLAAVGLLDLTGTTLFAVASTKGLVGVVSVLSSLYPVATVALARIFLGERLGASQALGVAAAFGGVVLISAA